MPILLPTQPTTTFWTVCQARYPFIGTYSFFFNFCHSLNPSFRRHSSIRSATVFNMPITLISFLVILSSTTSPTVFPGRKPSHLALAISGRPVIPSSMSSSCTVVIDKQIIIRAPVTHP
ncbi:hypothetical protein K503DRAFT_865498, partial [Rhizopogon vinicolor AM-OR11-026]